MLDEYLIRAGKSPDPSPDHDAHTAELVIDQLALTGVDPCTNVKPEFLHR